MSTYYPGDAPAYQPIPPRPPTLNYYKYAFTSPTIQPPLHESNANSATAARVAPCALSGPGPGMTQHDFPPRYHDYEPTPPVPPRLYFQFQRDPCPHSLAPHGSDLAWALGASPAISREPGSTVSTPKAPAAIAASMSSSSEWEAQLYSLPNIPKHEFELAPLPLDNGPCYIADYSRSSWQSWSAGVVGARRRESDPPSGGVIETQELSVSATDLPPVEPTLFISKLSHILELTEHSEYIRWSRDGKSILLASHHPNLLKVLSQYFKYTTISSLIRQLNVYSFKRLTTAQLLDVLDLTRSTKLSASDYCGFAQVEAAS